MAAQAEEREVAADMWTETGFGFTSPTGGPLNPNTDYHMWKRFLEDAQVGERRLHDARHTAATVLQMGRIAFEASFAKICERRLPALQRTDRSVRSRAQAAAKGA